MNRLTSCIFGSDLRLSSAKYGGWLLLAMICLSGCGLKPRTNVLTVVDRQTSGDEKRYYEKFDEAYYDLDGVGNVDLVLRRSRPSGDRLDQRIEQVVHVRSVWASVPGRTVANSTQINGRITYAILSGDAGSTFEGAGSVFFRKTKQWGNEVLVGHLERTYLKAKRSLTSEPAIFDQAEVSGEFRAVRDGRRVRQIVNDLNREFGAEAARSSIK